MRDYQGNPNKVNGWEMLRDVLVGAIDTGQIIPVGAMFLIALVILRLPAETLSATLNDVVTSLKHGSLLGWLLFIVALVAWRIQYCSVRDMHTNEMARVAATRDEIQRTYAAHPLGSSDAPQLSAASED